MPARSPMSRVGRIGAWSFDHARLTAGIWLALLVAVTFVSRIVGSDLTKNTTGGNTPAIQAQDLLRAQFPAFAGDQSEVVFTSRQALTAADRDRIGSIDAQLRALPHVTGVTGPFDHGVAGQVNDAATIAYAVVRYDEPAGDLPTKAIDDLVRTTKSVDSTSLHVVAGGAPVGITENPGFGAAEGVGLLAAAIILLFAFGSFVAMALPIVTALFGLATAFGVVDLISRGLTVPNFAPELAALLGIGVGIDYALFIVTRYRNHLHDGQRPQEAIAAALSTSGRAVVFAGTTVVISLLGLLLVGLPYITGAAVGAIVAVSLVMAAAVTLLPAALRVFGDRVAASRIRVRRTGRVGGLSVWWRWSQRVQRRPGLYGGAAAAVIVLLALPLFSLRLGYGDAGNNSKSDATRQVYDDLAAGFGAGRNGPLLIVATLPSGGDASRLAMLRADIMATSDVSAVSATEVSPSGGAAVLTVIPASAPQSAQTVALVHQLRDVVIPHALRGTGVTALVGGETAASIDSSAHLSHRLLVVISVVVLLALLLLAAVFRSVAIPIKAAVMNLLSTGAAYGVVVAIFQWGWAADVLNAGAKGPIDPWIPVMLFTILFGLSMDYELFLMSRVREEWLRSGDAHEAVATGLAATARVITTAAAIMICVFGAFALSDLRALKIFGLGMATAVLIDATLIRVLLVPAVLHMLGRRAWSLPGWVDRILPTITVEPGRAPAMSPASIPR